MLNAGWTAQATADWNYFRPISWVVSGDATAGAIILLQHRSSDSAETLRPH